MNKNRFTGNTRLFLGISCALVVIAIIMQIAGVGLNLGVDFTGGSILEYSVGESFDIDDVTMILESVDYGNAQVNKLAPSDASVALQSENEAAEETEEVAEEAAEGPAPMLNLDKSGIKDDGNTDLQIRLMLVDEAANMEACIVDAVEGTELSYEQLTYLSVTNGGYNTDFTGGYRIVFDMGGEFDLAAAEAAVNAALAEGGYSINNIEFSAIAPAAEVVEVEETEPEGEAEEAEEAEEVVEEVPAEPATQLQILVDLDDVTSEVRSVLEREMSAKYPNFHFISIDHVSAIAGRDLISNAVKALLIAFACMLIYIAIRFDLFSGLAALFGLAHDVLVMCAFMVFFRGLFQINSPFIAAILTIVGYSINNTIIIFDRIRENLRRPGMTQKSRTEVVEVSVSETLARTINTTLTTLITLVCLYIFGVTSIREFAFPLIIGMLAGTYSSVMLSGQVWASWTSKVAARKNASK
ncbi:MAG: protein translocase subunit SecF [Clostridia bacterium]|nr:protein translocase subunit SecF [Clostridia bacterium]